MEEEQIGEKELEYIESDDYDYEPNFDSYDTGFGKMDLNTCEWF